jgi:hypothetical protein
MSSRHSDEEPLARDAADELLDALLKDADVDLHAAIYSVVDLDSGLIRIVGTDRTARCAYGSEGSTIRANSIGEPSGRMRFRSALTQYWTLLLLIIGDVLQAFRRRGARWVKSVLLHHDFQFVGAPEYNFAHRAPLAEVRYRIDLLIGKLGGIRGLVDDSQRQRVVHFCVGRLAYLRKGLEDGEVSRDEANEIISNVQVSFRRSLLENRWVDYLGLVRTFGSVVSLSAVTLSALAHSAQWTNVWYYLICTLSFLVSIPLWFSPDIIVLSRRGKQLVNIDSELAGLRRVVRRLFDDADDLDFDRSNLPC